jgi:hypothetical protein
MPKMTPEQEAVYALDYGSTRGSLSPAGQEAYDRLVERRRRGEPDEPVNLGEVEAAGRAVMQDAKRALAEGRRVFLCRVPAMYDQPIAVGTAGLSGPSSVIESLENMAGSWTRCRGCRGPDSGRRATSCSGMLWYRRRAPRNGAHCSSSRIWRT